MALEPSAISELDAETLAANEAYLAAFVKELYPNIDLSPSSAVYQLVVRLSAIFQAFNQDTAARLQQSNSLLMVNADPTLADDTTVDNLLSNYLITRQTGNPGSGQAQILLNANVYTAIPDSVVFTANGLTFKPTRSFAGVTSSDQVISTDKKLITQIDDDVWAFVIDLVADEAGIDGNVSKNTVFSIDSVLPQISNATAYTDFSGGSDTETNTQLIARLNQGISNASLGNRQSIRALVLNNYPAVRDISIIGAADVEMRRDQHNTLGVSSYGKSDIYLRTNTLPITSTMVKTATLQDAALGSWTITFGRDEAPGAYTVRKVSLLENTSPLDIESLTRSIDDTEVDGLDFTPAMTGAEGVFTRYQTMTVTFTYENDEYEQGDTLDVNVDVMSMPLIDSISDFILDRQYRHTSGDYLVKAAIPCLVSVGINIVLGPGDPTPDTGAIKSAIASAVNALDFQSNTLSIDTIISATRNLLTGRTRVKLPIDLRGEIIYPSVNVIPGDPVFSGSIFLFDSQALTIPTVASAMVSPRTVSFYLDPNNISVNILPSDHVIV